MPKQPPGQPAARTAAAHLERGRAAETLAERFLAAEGLVVIARNFRCRAGELDLVCLDAEVLAIVEVRQRARSDFGGALGSVTRAKRRKLMRAAQFFLRCSTRWRGRVLRFDVVALQGDPGVGQDLVWVRDAFREP
jgi:putative endonuclease